jgi:hypothetical protein
MVLVATEELDEWAQHLFTNVQGLGSLLRRPKTLAAGLKTFCFYCL